MLVGRHWELAAVGAVLDRASAGHGCVVELDERHPAAWVHGGDAAPIVDAEVIEPEPGRTEPRSPTEALWAIATALQQLADVIAAALA